MAKNKLDGRAHAEEMPKFIKALMWAGALSFCLWAVLLFFSLLSCSLLRGNSPTGHSFNNGTVTLSWDPVDYYADGTASSPALGYNVYYGVTMDEYSPLIYVGDVTEYVFTGLDGHVRFFAVSAVNSYGEGEKGTAMLWQEKPIGPPSPKLQWRNTPGDTLFQDLVISDSSDFAMPLEMEIIVQNINLSTVLDSLQLDFNEVRPGWPLIQSVYWAKNQATGVWSSTDATVGPIQAGQMNAANLRLYYNGEWSPWLSNAIRYFQIEVTITDPLITETILIDVELTVRVK